MDYLYNPETGTVWARSPELAERNDLKVITEEEAAALTKSKQKQTTAQQIAAKDENQKQAEKTVINFDTMDETDLRAEAAKMKISLKPGMPVEQMRKKLKKVAIDDALEAKQQANTPYKNDEKPAPLPETPVVAPAKE